MNNKQPKQKVNGVTTSHNFAFGNTAFLFTSQQCSKETKRNEESEQKKKYLYENYNRRLLTRFLFTCVKNIAQLK